MCFKSVSKKFERLWVVERLSKTTLRLLLLNKSFEFLCRKTL